MELTITLAISILSAVISVSNFVLNRKDKAIKDTEDITKDLDKGCYDQKLVDYRLTKVEEKLDKILDILDNYDTEIDKRIEKVMDQHLKIYHKEGI